MKLRKLTLLTSLTLLVASAWAQSKPSGVLSADELKKVAPTSFFYRGQSGGVQLRNTGGFRTKDQKFVLAGLVDTSGYASAVAEKYQGFFITEVKLNVAGSELAPGEYGFAFNEEKFTITDAGANDVLSGTSTKDPELKHPVPLKMVEEGGEYRLYAGKKYVTVKVE